MTDIQVDKKNREIVSFFGGLLGISIIIIIHELGHFCAAHFFSIPIPTFSIGFGPALLKIPLFGTIFQLALLPFGGYVEINQEILEQHPYLDKIIVMLAGIIFNFIFALLVLSYYALCKTSIRSCLSYIYEQKEVKGIIGPIGLIHIIGKCFNVNRSCFWIILAIISINIGLFNLLPFPFLDGGKVLLFTLEALLKQPIPAGYLNFISLVVFFFFMLLLSCTSVNDIKKLQGNK